MSSLTDLIGLSGWSVTDAEQRGSGWQVAAQPELQRSSCPHCGAKAQRQHRHGWRTRCVSHIPVGIALCDLRVRFVRYRCQDCRRTHTPELPGIRRRARLSDGLRGFVQWLAKQFQLGVKQLAGWLGLGWNTVWRCIEQAPSPDLSTVRDLCLDEVFYREPRKYLMVLSSADGRVLDLEPGRGERPSNAVLLRLPEVVREQIETLATDFNAGQRKAARASLPQAEIVADCFHLVRLARRAVRDAQPTQRAVTVIAARELRLLLRRREPAALSGWLQRWRGQSGTLRRLWNTVDRWELEIEGYLTTGRSTGPAEALNRRIALLRRRACGYTNLDNFIRRIMLLNLSLHPQR